jgi:hypothetical protein
MSNRSVLKLSGLEAVPVDDRKLSSFDVTPTPGADEHTEIDEAE